MCNIDLSLVSSHHKLMYRTKVNHQSRLCQDWSNVGSLSQNLYCLLMTIPFHTNRNVHNEQARLRSATLNCPLVFGAQLNPCPRPVYQHLLGSTLFHFIIFVDTSIGLDVCSPVGLLDCGINQPQPLGIEIIFLSNLCQA